MTKFEQRIRKLCPLFSAYGISLSAVDRAEVHRELRSIRGLLADERIREIMTMGRMAYLHTGSVHPTVHMDSYWDRILTDAELKAVAYHEVGHILLGHVREGRERKDPIQDEIDADMYSVMLGSNPRALMTAMSKIMLMYKRRGMKYRLGVCAAWTPEMKSKLEEEMKAEMSSDMIKKRFKALSAL